ncbi:phosphopantetheine-binding protein [Acetobacteraceae bacterium H6797]|nr:phosphopantetheine-binding protein [Acetobacteraceae bacterium H6797]
MSLTREKMHADIARALRMPVDEVMGDDDLNDLGLDSMRAMNLVLSWQESGVTLEFGQLAENVTLDAWWALAQQAMAKNG